MRVEVQDEYFSVKQCEENPDKLYVFGDNTLRSGKKGQAVIRNCENSFGIPTKKFPSMSEMSFFSDEPEELMLVEIALDQLYELSKIYGTIVFPKDGLGTGLAKMNTKSPKLFWYLKSKIKLLFGVEL